MKYILSFILSVVTCSTATANCSVTDAKITGMHRYTDGTLFINTNKANDCGCSQGARFAMKTTDVDSDSFTVSAALTAFTAGIMVSINGLDGCSIHGNTPELNYLKIHK